MADSKLASVCPANVKRQRLSSIDQVIHELDAWMQHYVGWEIGEPSNAHFHNMTIACEKARDTLVRALTDNSNRTLAPDDRFDS